MQVCGQSGEKECDDAVYISRLARCARSSSTVASSPREVIDAEFVYGHAYGRGWADEQCIRGECGENAGGEGGRGLLVF